MMLLVRYLPILLLVVIVIAVDANDTSLNDGNFWEFSSCTLQCANGGQCRFLSGTADILARIAQSNGLVETCVCEPRYFGHTCQYTIEECNPNNDAATPVGSPSGCDCSIADYLSDFAGRMCRKPITEVSAYHDQKYLRDDLYWSECIIYFSSPNYYSPLFSSIELL